jgi:hypothetical protein
MFAHEMENYPMNVAYSDRAKQVREYFELLQQVTERLKEVLGPSQDVVRAQWDQVEDDRGRSLYSLKISDFTGEVEATFTPEELQRGTHIRVKLYKLWGDLLQARNHKQREALQGGANDE